MFAARKFARYLPTSFEVIAQRYSRVTWTDIIRAGISSSIIITITIISMTIVAIKTTITLNIIRRITFIDFPYR